MFPIAHTHTAVAILQHQRGSYGHALTLYNKVIQSETTMAQLHDRQVDPRFLLNRGDTYLKLNQLQQVRCERADGPSCTAPPDPTP